MYKSQTLSAGVGVEFEEVGTFFRLLAAAQSDLTVIFYNAGREVFRAENIGAGYSEYGFNFDRVRMTSTIGGAFTFVVRAGSQVAYDAPPTGNVTVINTPGAFTNTAKTVTNVSATLVAANVTRRYLLIQNNDATGILYVRVDGIAAATATGVKIMPGGSFELSVYCPSGAITAIGSIASNANVVVVEA